MDEGGENQELLSLTTKIVASHAGSNKLATSDLPALIGSVFEALRTAGTVEVGKPAEALVPAVPIKKSVMPEFIVCLEDGRKMKTLKRHLATRYNLTPAEYRQRWGLPNDYPMVAPAYAAQRSALAKSIGLGRKRADAAPEPKPEPVAQKPARRVTAGRKMPKTAA
jgi:predicted transcriptional regulator